MRGKGARGEVGLVPPRELVPGEGILIEEGIELSLKCNPFLALLRTVRSSDGHVLLYRIHFRSMSLAQTNTISRQGHQITNIIAIIAIIAIRSSSDTYFLLLTDTLFLLHVLNSTPHLLTGPGPGTAA